MISIVKIGEITKYLDEIKFDYKLFGDYNTLISTFSSIDNLFSNSISWIKDGYKYNTNGLTKVRNILIITDDPMLISNSDNGINILKCESPRNCYFSILTKFFPRDKRSYYKSPTARIESNQIHSNTYIGHNSIIDQDVTIDEGTIIKNNVVIEGKVTIGKNSIIQSGAIIGSDGFGYYVNHNGINTKIDHYGGVKIGNNVEVGANTCINKGTLKDTVVSDNTKIGNLCHIAHNVYIGPNVLITSGVSISGSTNVQKNTYIAPQSTIKNKLEIKSGSFVGLGSVVVKDVNESTLVMGVPAKEIKKI